MPLQPSTIVLALDAHGGGELFLRAVGGARIAVPVRPSLVRLIVALQNAYETDEQKPWKNEDRWGWRHPLDLKIDLEVSAGTVAQYISLLNRSVRRASRGTVRRVVLREAGKARLIAPVEIVPAAERQVPDAEP